MKYLFSIRCVCLVVFAVVCFAPGCGKKLPPMAPVSGKVTVDGQPLTAGQVSLIPDIHATDEDAKKAKDSTPGISSGKIESDGTYKITTAGHSGAPLGKYKVTVTPSMVPTGNDKAPPTAYNPAFQDPQNSTLRVEVIANPEAGRYDLKLSK